MDELRSVFPNLQHLEVRGNVRNKLVQQLIDELALMRSQFPRTLAQPTVLGLFDNWAGGDLISNYHDAGVGRVPGSSGPALRHGALSFFGLGDPNYEQVADVRSAARHSTGHVMDQMLVNMSGRQPINPRVLPGEAGGKAFPWGLPKGVEMKHALLRGELAREMDPRLSVLPEPILPGPDSPANMVEPLRHRGVPRSEEAFAHAFDRVTQGAPRGRNDVRLMKFLKELQENQLGSASMKGLKGGLIPAAAMLGVQLLAPKIMGLFD